MATKSLHISEVYASQLEEFRQGHPLWCPSGPEGADEIDLGDIGYIWEGQFVELFKGKYARDHPANAKNRQYNRIPPSHERLPERAYIRPLRSTRDMEPDMYTTKSMKHQKIQPSAGAEIPGVAGVNAKYTLITTEEKAAFLYITHKATKTIIENSIAFKNYVKQYHSAWLEHARNELGIDLRGRDIIMVHGFVKTVEWIVGASRGGSVEQGGSVELQGGVPMVVGKVALELETKVAKAPQMFYLSGPEERIAHSRSPSPSIASFRNSVTEEPSHSRHFGHSTLEVPQPQIPALKVSSEEPKYDQCIFLRYFQVKWRIGAYLHIKAGAGPHQLPRGPDSGGEGSSAPAVSDSGSESDVESNLPSQPTHTWLDILLEYLLRHSDAEVAIACHGDIYSLTLEEEIVEDFAEYLERTRPKIDVDEDKVATLDIVDLVMKQRERELRGINSSLKGKDNDTMDTDPDEPDDEDKDESWRGSDREISDGELVCGHPPTTYKWLHFSLSGKDGDAGYISSVALSPNGTLVAAGCLDGATQLWRTKTGQLVRVLEGHHAETVWSVGFSPDGNLLASGDTEGAVLVRAANDIPHVANTFAQGEHAGVRLGDVLFNLEGHSSDVTALVFSPNGKWLASGSIDCTSKLWPISLEGHGGGFPIVMQARHTLDSLSAHVSNVAFTPDSKRIVLSGDTAVKVWDVESGDLIATMSGHTGPIWSLALSHDGERLATGSEDHTTRIWATESGTELVIIAEQGGPVWSVAWSEDDKYVVSGSYDSTAMVCDSFTGGVVREFKEPTSGATPVIWLTSDIVCTGTADGPVKLWDLNSGECLAALHGHEDKIKDLLPSSDGRDIISYSDDGSIRIWNVSQVLRLV